MPSQQGTRLGIAALHCILCPGFPPSDVSSYSRYWSLLCKLQTACECNLQDSSTWDSWNHNSKSEYIEFPGAKSYLEIGESQLQSEKQRWQSQHEPQKLQCCTSPDILNFWKGNNVWCSLGLSVWPIGLTVTGKKKKRCWFRYICPF